MAEVWWAVVPVAALVLMLLPHQRCNKIPVLYRNSFALPSPRLHCGCSQLRENPPSIPKPLSPCHFLQQLLATLLVAASFPVSPFFTAAPQPHGGPPPLDPEIQGLIRLF